MGTVALETIQQVDAATVLFGSTRRRVLGWLLGHPDEAFYLRQIARLTGAGLSAVQRELEQLTLAGLLLRTLRGHQVYFQANRAAPIFPELSGLFAKTAGLGDLVREALAPLTSRLRLAFIFGSAARGELSAASDVDLLVVGDVTFQELVAALGVAQERLGREINPTLYSPDEFRAKLQGQHHFLTAVLREPQIPILGGADELAGLGA
jgi:predicted nucleotidyltransferase